MNLYRSDGSLAGHVDVVTTYGNGKIKLTMENGGNFNFNKGEVVYHRAGDCWIMTKREQKPASKLTFASIKCVIFNPPATIVFWSDGTKTVVKCSKNDIFDPEKGLAMAITKRAQGNCSNYYKEIRHWVEKKWPRKPIPENRPTDYEVLKKYISKANNDCKELINASMEGEESVVILRKLTALTSDLTILDEIINKN